MNTISEPNKETQAAEEFKKAAELLQVAYVEACDAVDLAELRRKVALKYSDEAWDKYYRSMK